MHAPPLRAIALVLLLAPTARIASGEPPGEETAEALRERLVAAHAAAPRIHRAYELTLGGEATARFEIFREDRAHGMRMESAAGASERFAADVTWNGSILVIQHVGAPRRLRLPMPTDPRGRTMEAVLLALGRMHGFDPGSMPEWRPHFKFRMPQADPAEPADADVVGLRAGLEVTSEAAPGWLDSTVWERRHDPAPLARGLVAARIAGYDAVLHASDGCIASVGGKKPGTDVPWTMRETRPAISASSWRERIAHTCRADDGTFEGVPADLEGSCYLWWPVVKLAHGMGERFASPVWRRPAIELIANAAWADRATTEQWLAELREEEGTRAAARSASEPRAARAVREQQALDAWIAKTQARLLDPVWFTGLTPEVEADIRAQFRDWIARRLRDLASEVRRGMDAAAGR